MKKNQEYESGIGVRTKPGGSIDLSGMRFGKLKVVRRVGSEKGHSVFECRCDCGNLIKLRASRLKTKTYVEKSCGCIKPVPGRFTDLTGQRFGKLVVKSQAKSRSKKSGAMSRWNCVCDCGEVVVILGDNLQKGATKSCGCLFTEFVHRLDEGLAAKKYMFRITKGNAKRRGIPFNLSFKSFVKLSEQDCSYCGCKPYSIQEGVVSQGKTYKHYGSWIHQGIDRIDSSKSYELSNCVSCCKKCNVAKSTMSVAEFRSHIRRIFCHQHRLEFEETESLLTRTGNGYSDSAVFKNLSGQKYGKLTVIERICSINGHSFFKCRCDCGGEIDMFGFQLKGRRTHHCGCSGKEPKAPKFTLDGVKQSHFRLHNVKSKKRGILSSLHFDEFVSLCESPCNYCGSIPDRLIRTDKKGNGWKHGGIDRIDSSGDYELENVVPCCEMCNLIKMNLEVKAFTDHIDRIVDHLNIEKINDRENGSPNSEPVL